MMPALLHHLLHHLHLASLAQAGQAQPGRLRIPRLGPFTGSRAAHARAGVAMPAIHNHAPARAGTLPSAATSPTPPSLLSTCTLTWRTATLDHFGWGKRVRAGGSANTWRQRVFVCARAWKAMGAPPSPTIFFYAANEANAELYLNHTGAMWEAAEEFGAILVFPEHRFYGESVPFGGGRPPAPGACVGVGAALADDGTACPANATRVTAMTPWDREAAVHAALALHPRRLRYLSAEQALADYAGLITELRSALPGGSASPVIAFGGSYGGMLATWLRQVREKGERERERERERETNRDRMEREDPAQPAPLTALHTHSLSLSLFLRNTRTP